MALPDSLKIVDGTQIVLADSTDYGNVTAANKIADRTDQIDLTSLADSAYRQSDQIDFGANRAPLWLVSAVFEFAVAPTDGEVVYIYLAPAGTSTSAKSANASGSDAAYTGHSADADDAIKQAILIGTFICVGTTNVQIQVDCGRFTPPTRYGSIIVRNESGQAMAADANEMSIVLTPLEHQVQD